MTVEDKKGDDKNSGELEKKIEALMKEIDAGKADKAKLLSDIERRDADLMSPLYLAYLEKVAAGDSTDKGGTKEEVDYEDMSKAQLVKLLSEQNETKIKDMDTLFGKKLEDLTSKVSLAFAQLDLARARDKNPDFKWDEHKEAFYAKSKENPKWSAAKVMKDVERDLKEAADAKASELKIEAEKEQKALTEKAGNISTDSTQHVEISDKEAGEVGFSTAYGNKES